MKKVFAISLIYPTDFDKPMHMKTRFVGLVEAEDIQEAERKLGLMDEGGDQINPPYLACQKRSVFLEETHFFNDGVQLRSELGPPKRRRVRRVRR